MLKLSLLAADHSLYLFHCRTRDENVLKDCDIVVDVGAVYDPDQHRYDHHQKSVSYRLVPRPYSEHKCMTNFILILKPASSIYTSVICGLLVDY